jgi:membrane fusion protein (multidrug efflux system)
MKKLHIFLFILMTMLFVYLNCTKEKSGAKSMEQLYKENGVPVKVQVVELKPLTSEHTFHAVLSGIKETAAKAMVSDKVEKIHYNVGDYVAKDAVVISFPTTNPAAQYFQAKVAYEHAEATLKRMEDLYQDGGISLQDLENIRTQFQVAQANWDAVKKSVKVEAPISGRLTSINVQETDNVKSGDVLFTISQTQKLKAKLWVAENQINDFQVGNKATASWQSVTLEGEVTQVDMSLNSEKQAFGVTLEFDNPNEKIMSGVNAEIKIFTSYGEKAVIIDRKNLINRDNRDYVFVAENGIAREQEIKIGKSLGLDVEVVNGLKQGDSLIVEGQLLLEDAAKIKIIKE